MPLKYTYSIHGFVFVSHVKHFVALGRVFAEFKTKLDIIRLCEISLQLDPWRVTSIVSLFKQYTVSGGKETNFAWLLQNFATNQAQRDRLSALPLREKISTEAYWTDTVHLLLITKSLDSNLFFSLGINNGISGYRGTLREQICKYLTNDHCSALPSMTRYLIIRYLL